MRELCTGLSRIPKRIKGIGKDEKKGEEFD